MRKWTNERSRKPLEDEDQPRAGVNAMPVEIRVPPLGESLVDAVVGNG